MKLITLLVTLLLIPTSIEANPLKKLKDKAKDVAPIVLPLIEEERKKKEKEEQERKKKLEEENRKKQEEAERLEKQKQEEIQQQQSLINFYELFNDEGTALVTEKNVVLDDFGDEITSESTYFVVKDQKYDVAVNCKMSLNEFPFQVRAKFDQKLNYDIDRNSVFIGHIKLNYKLGSGVKDSMYHEGMMFIFNSNLSGISTENLDQFALWSGNDLLNKNLEERKESLSNGEIHILIPIRSSEEKYSLKFNPFHRSWSDFHKLKCGTQTT